MASDPTLVAPVPTASLRWQCDPGELGFESTADIEPIEGIIGQAAAVEALRFGLEIDAAGQNVYVRGLAGTGRLTLVRKLLEEISNGRTRARDVCYVHRFEQPDRPRVIRLPAGKAEVFRSGMSDLMRFVVEDLPRGLNDDLVMGRKAELERATQAAIEARTTPLEQGLAEAGLALKMAKAGGTMRPMVLPIIGGEAILPERFSAMRSDGSLDEATAQAFIDKAEEASSRVDEVFRGVARLHSELRKRLRELLSQEAERLVRSALDDLREELPQEEVQQWLDDVAHDVAHRRLGDLEKAQEWTSLYQVNVVISHDPASPPPVIVENAPSMRTLTGSIDTAFDPEGDRLPPHMFVHGGSLLRADGGVLVIEARDVLANPGAWEALVRTLRSGRVELVPPEMIGPWKAPAIKPDPVEVEIKVVLLGDAQLYYLLDQRDAYFPHLFKVLADFDHVLERTDDNLKLYAGVVARIARDEGLPPFHAEAVALLAEHGVRIAADGGRLTARIGRVVDIAREAAFLARKRGETLVLGSDVSETVRRTKARADGPARRFREQIAKGAIRIATRGEAVGQVNGLAVIKAGPLTYGFPSRITATVAPGAGGAINIEREAQLSGAIHTKAFYILGGLLRELLQTPHPLVFEASIAFEQSYGGIDGDSASGAEIVCLLSALTGLPIRQGLAMTGAIDQKGNVLPIGAVTEKIEGFFDTCVDAGFNGGEQGVIIPRANVEDLMLRRAVVDACEQGKFNIYAVSSIGEAISLFFGRPSGLEGGRPYPEGTVLQAAVQAARRLWQRASGNGQSGASEER